MAYYFVCETCRTKETFGTTKLFEEIPMAKKQDYESVICSSCITSKTRLKCNYIIIEKGTK